MKYALISFLLISSTAFAKTFDLKNRFGIGGGAGWTFPIGNGKFNNFADDDFTWNAHVRYHTSSWDSLQLNYQNYEFADTTIGANVTGLMWIRRINPGDKLTPIFGLGAGVADMRNIGPYHDNLKFAGRARLGMEYMLNDDVSLSATVDYQYIGKMPSSSNDSNGIDRNSIPGKEIHALVPQMNLTVYFGPDKEMHEHKGAAAVPVAAAFVDSDHDGVGDPNDKCPQTPQGQQVNNYGCLPDEKANVELEILFATGSAQIPPASQVAIQDLGNFMKNHPETKVEIQGHTDNSGNAKRNKKLSQDRADAVMAYLVEKMDIPASRVSAYGYGAEKPAASNATAEGRKDNRRVMAVISQ
ncbi:MAG: OmpA family protein [Bacteriovoracaceae bacterium]